MDFSKPVSFCHLLNTICKVVNHKYREPEESDLLRIISCEFYLQLEGEKKKKIPVSRSIQFHDYSRTVLIQTLLTKDCLHKKIGRRGMEPNLNLPLDPYQY